MGGKRQWIVAAPLALELIWNGKNLAGIRLDWAKSRKGDKALSGLSEQVAVGLAKYVRGQPAKWPDMPLDTDGMSEFKSRVLMTLASDVPHGSTVSYGELAGMCGKPEAARAVGRIMASNPWPLLVPCHRVVGADGKLTGFSGCGLPMKKFLLQLEGVNI